MVANIGKYKVLRILSDTSATVYEVTDGEKIYVAKELKENKRNRKERALHKFFSALNRDHFVQIHDEVYQNGFVYLILERFLSTAASIVLETTSVLNFALHTLRGLRTLELHDYTADDVKLENFLVKGFEGSRRIALCDMGGVRRKDEPSSEHTAVCATPKQLAGEIDSNTSIYGWALAFERLSTGYVGVTRGGQSLGSLNAWVGSAFDEWLQACVHPDEHQRHTVSDTYHFFQNISTQASNNRCPVHGYPVIPDATCCFCCNQN